MKKKELKKQIEELAQKVAFMSEKMYKLEVHVRDLQSKDAKRERNIIPKPTGFKVPSGEIRENWNGNVFVEDTTTNRTMKDVMLGDIVRYVTPMPERTWMSKGWGNAQGLVINGEYPVVAVDPPLSSIKVSGGNKENLYNIDIKCFELING
jgi:hypothetical protein